MARSNAAVAKVDPAATMTAEEEAQLAQMQADETEAPEIAEVSSDPGASESAENAAQIETTVPAQPERKMVPLPALHEERERRKQAEAQLAEERQRMRMLEERTNLLLQRQVVAQQPVQNAIETPALPDVATDPVGHITAKLDRTERELAQFREVEAQRQQQLQGLQQLQRVEQNARAMEQVFAADHPDYGNAVNHVFARRHEELNALGMRDPVARQAQIQQEAFGLAHTAMQNGVNPAEALYALAQQRGYQVPSAAASAAATTAAPEVAQGAVATQTPTQRIQQLAAGQQQARSLGNARGSGPVPMTAQRLLEMSEAEFGKMMETEEGRALLGA